jgi:hypothetical protein
MGDRQALISRPWDSGIPDVVNVGMWKCGSGSGMFREEQLLLGVLETIGSHNARRFVLGMSF